MNFPGNSYPREDTFVYLTLAVRIETFWVLLLLYRKRLGVRGVCLDANGHGGAKKMTAEEEREKEKKRRGKESGMKLQHVALQFT